MMTKDEILQEWSGAYEANPERYDPKIVADLEGALVLFAEYDQGEYEGDAAVIYHKDGKLFEVYGSHCSCNGLEDQWSPEETTVEAILARQHDYGTQRDARVAIKTLHEAGFI